MEVSPFDQNTVYYGSQYLHRTRDGGVTWEKISPDLTAHPPGTQGASGEPITRDATGEEVYSTLYSIRESPVQQGVIWTGSNDGLVYVTRDDGKTWTNVTPERHAAGRPRAEHRAQPAPRRERPTSRSIAILLGDFAPYIYRTDDFGKTWTQLTDGKNGIAADEPTRVVREDPDRAGLLYAGTEFGMYISFDNGAHWQPFQMNLPVTPVTDIKVAHKDLVLSTQGRSFWILDNLTPLHQIKESDRDGIGRALHAARGGPHQRAAAAADAAAGFSIRSPAREIDYYLGKAPAGDFKMEVLDGAGKVVRKFTSARRPRGGGRAGRADFAPATMKKAEEAGEAAAAAR